LDWVENNVAKLIDADGREADTPGLEKYLERPNEVGYSYLFPVDEDLTGWTFIYETPAGIAEIPVDYELKNIPLP
jgi:predicted acetyltransferase